jgi:PilZ domain
MEAIDLLHCNGAAVSRIWDALKQAENERSRSKGRKQAGRSPEHAPVPFPESPPAHPNSDGADRRRSKRWEQPVPVLVYGSDSDKQPFHEETETADINDDGCSFVLETTVVKGQRLFLVNMRNDAERECSVIQTAAHKRSTTRVAVEFTGPAPDFWLGTKS